MMSTQMQVSLSSKGETTKQGLQPPSNSSPSPSHTLKEQFGIKRSTKHLEILTDKGHAKKIDESKSKEI